MNINRKIDLSVYYWLKDTLDASVTVVDGFPMNEFGVPAGELSLPTVASDRAPITTSPLELGGGDSRDTYMYYLDVYAKTKSQRDDIVYLIMDALHHNIVVKNYDLGFPPSVYPSGIGALVPTGDIMAQNLYVFPEGNQKLYWRSVIDFRGYYTT